MQNISKFYIQKIPESKIKRPFSVESTIGDVQITFIGRMLLKMIESHSDAIFGDDEEAKAMGAAMLMDAPLRTLAALSSGAVKPSLIDGMVEIMNRNIIKGLKLMLKK